jgi:DNA topoisomerase-6 subunit A
MVKDYSDVIKKIDSIAYKLYNDLQKTEIPYLNLPTRSKSNIEFDDKLNVWKYGSNKIERSAKSLDGAMMLLRTMYMVDFIKEMIKVKKSSTLREMYYISEGWDLGKFNSQNESNLLAEDLEVITSLMREDFKLRPEEDGARVIGNLTIEELTRNNRKKRIHCQDDVGDSGYSIPYNVEAEKINFKSIDADFIIAIETGGMFDRLVENKFDTTYHAILVHLKGQPARSTRRFIKRMNEESNIPVVVFTDCDPWSFRIFASLSYGAIKTAHISEYLATPASQFLGVTPSDIENYNLPTDSLSREDIKSLKSELTDPRFQDSFWKNEIKLQLKMGKKSEQQALAKYGLDYVTDTYLPEKLTEIGMIKK